MVQNPTQVNTDNYINTRVMANKIIWQYSRLSKKKAHEEIEIHKKNPWLFFEKCNSIKDGFIMKDDENNLLSSPELI